VLAAETMGTGMRRREFFALLGGAAASAPFAARAQQPGGIRRVGVMLSLAADDPVQKSRRESFEQTLTQHGWENGRNLRIDYRFGGGGADKFAALAKELVALQPDVIFAQSTGVVTAVAQETRTIPVVFVNVSDPVGAGFVASLPRPGGNLTGMLLFDADLSGKWLAMLKEVSPKLRRAVLVIDPKTTPLDYFYRSAEAVAPSLAVEIAAAQVASTADIERAMEANGRIPDSGFVIAPGSTILRNRDLIIALAIRHRLPGIYPESVFARAGGLLSYGIADALEPFRQAASYVDRILRGAKPSDLPVQGPTRYATVVNLRTARAIGLDVPPMLLAQADEVIE
jgi:putative ABC transport system substrate-binding protein